MLSTVINFEDKISIFSHFLKKDTHGDTMGNDVSWVSTLQGPCAGKSEQRIGLTRN